MDKSEQNRGLLAPQRGCSLQLQILSTIMTGMGKPGVLRGVPAGTAPFLPECKDRFSSVLCQHPSGNLLHARSQCRRTGEWMDNVMAPAVRDA